MTKEFILAHELTIVLPKKIVGTVREMLEKEHIDYIKVIEKRYQRCEGFISFEYIKNKDKSTSFILRGRHSHYADKIMAKCILDLAKEGKRMLGGRMWIDSELSKIRFLNPNKQ